MPLRGTSRFSPLTFWVALLVVASYLLIGGAATAISAENVSEAAYHEPIPKPGDPYFEAKGSDGEWISYVNPRDLYRTPYLGNSSGENVSEAAYHEPVPKPGDPYFEAEGSDGEWISYVNPRDLYRTPYLGNGSGQICVTLLNEAGEPIVGESVPNTTVSVPTGDSIAWHRMADPVTVQYPLTEHYDRPLDADQFGTNPELPQGDGYLDSHCVGFHGLPSNETIEFGEASIDGPSAHKIELVGYIEQSNQAWDSTADPIADSVSYGETGGAWTFTPEASHGQVVVVLQLVGEETGDDRSAESPEQTSDDTASSAGVDSTGSDTSAHSADDEVRGDHDAGIGDRESVSSGVSDQLVLLGAGLLAMVGLLSVVWRSRFR